MAVQDEALIAAATRLREVALQIKGEAEALLQSLEVAAECGIELRDLDRKHIQVRFIEQLPYMLEKKAALLVPVEAPAEEVAQ